MTFWRVKRGSSLDGDRKREGGTFLFRDAVWIAALMSIGLVLGFALGVASVAGVAGHVFPNLELGLLGVVLGQLVLSWTITSAKRALDASTRERIVGNRILRLGRRSRTPLDEE